jgi:fructose/tagatose bisphosphate aldolase
MDGSSLPLDENVQVTREARRIATQAGMSLEAAVGEIGDEAANNTTPAEPTEPETAAELARKTQADALAVAVGTRHGHYEVPPRLDIVRLRAIAAMVPAPLVLHGGSYVPDNELQAAIAVGVAKVNIATELEDAFLAAVGRLDLSSVGSISDVTGCGYDALRARICLKMQTLGSSDRI